MAPRCFVRRFVLSGFERAPLLVVTFCALLTGTACNATSLGAVPPEGLVPATRAMPQEAGPSRYLYVADWANNQIDIFQMDRLRRGVISTIRKHVSSPDGIFTDSAGRLYVADADQSGHDLVRVYSAEGKLIGTYGSFKFVVDVTVNAAGVVYIADYDSGQIAEFRPGSQKRSLTLTVPGYPNSVAVDSKGNLYVGYNMAGSYYSEVARFRPGSKRGQSVIPSGIVRFVGSVAVDKHGVLLVANEAGGVIDVFAKLNSPPSRTITTGTIPPRIGLRLMKLSTPFSCRAQSFPVAQPVAKFVDPIRSSS